MLARKKAVGIPHNTMFNYQLDHLAITCIVMGIPLLLFDHHLFENAKKYYPGLKSKLLAYEELSPEFLVSNYDLLVTSEIWPRLSFQRLHQPLEKKYQKKMRHLFSPHGFSDKVFYFKACAEQDILLVYGQHMLDLFKQAGVLNQLEAYVVTGNCRFQFYKQQQSFFDAIVKEEVWSKFAEERPTILYAPTWRDEADSSTFFECTELLIDHLPSDYNLLIKLHPLLEELNPAPFYKIIGKYEGRGDVQFLIDYPLVYPILSKCLCYIGDISSIGYDFLAFNRPMFFLVKEGNKRETPYLFRCGTTIEVEDRTKIYAIIAKKLKRDQKDFAKIREETYNYTFEKERPFSEIRRDIFQICCERSLL